jgi:hypothetical protein
MNINQIMQIYSWDVESMERLDVSELDTALVTSLNTPVQYITTLIFDSTGICIFNNVTSEVLLVVLVQCGFDVYATHTHPIDYIQSYYGSGFRICSESEILDTLCQITGKAVDVIVPIEISPEDLAALDDLAAQSNITRNDVVTKALIAAVSSYS